MRPSGTSSAGCSACQAVIQIFHTCAVTGDGFCQCSAVAKTIVGSQGGNRFGQGIQVGLVHGVGLIAVIMRQVVFVCGLVRHEFLVFFQVGLVFRFCGNTLLLCLQHQSLMHVPGIQRSFQEILLPGGHAAVHRTALGIQAFGIVRLRLGLRLAVTGDFQPVVDLQLTDGKLGIADGCDHGTGGIFSLGAADGIAAQAGCIIGISVGRGGRHRLCLHGGFDRFFGHSRLAAARQQHHCQSGAEQTDQKTGLFHKKVPF